LLGLERTVNDNKSLTIGYSTLADRVSNIKFIEEFTNLVVVQNSKSQEAPSLGSKIAIIQLSNIGVAKSRNAAIDSAQTKYLLFGDDDVTFKKEGIHKVIAYMDENPQISVIVAQAVDESGMLRKHYPVKTHSLGLTNSAKAATYEMVIRVSDVKTAGIRFDENFGAGAVNYLGDEYIFIVDCLRSGLKGKFLPIVIAEHPAHSSGNMRRTKEDISARAKIFSRVFGIWALPMRFAFLIKPPVKKFGFVNSIRFVIGK